MNCSIEDKLTLLLVGEEDLGAHVFQVLNIVVHNVGGESFDSVVEFVFVQMFARPPNEEVRPSMNLNAISVLVSFDISQSLLQNCSVQKRVQSISRNAECLHATGHDLVIVVLLLCQVLYKSSNLQNTYQKTRLW